MGLDERLATAIWWRFGYRNF